MQSRGRPKKDFWELKSKLAVEAAENKWKFSRGRPKKQRKLEDSVNTKISNSRKDILNLENQSKIIHNNIASQDTGFLNKKTAKDQDEEYDQFGKKLLYISIVVFVLCVLWLAISKIIKGKELVFSEITQNMEANDDWWQNLQMQIWYNDENWEFVEVENVEIINNEELIINNDEGNTTILVEPDKISNSDVDLIKSFYDQINNRNFSELTNITDRYLRNSDAYRTYFSSNWLNNFLDKIAWNKIFISWISESPSDKPNVKHYRYNVKYKVLNSNELTNEEWEIVMVDRNWERLIWSIMCITTWCSKMPFFQK